MDSTPSENIPTHLPRTDTRVRRVRRHRLGILAYAQLIVCGQRRSHPHPHPRWRRARRAAAVRRIARAMARVWSRSGADGCHVVLEQRSSMSTTGRSRTRFIATAASMRWPVEGRPLRCRPAGMRALTIANPDIACRDRREVDAGVQAPASHGPRRRGRDMRKCDMRPPAALEQAGTCDRLQRMLRASPALTSCAPPCPMKGVTMPDTPHHARRQPAAAPGQHWKTSVPAMRCGCSAIQRSTASMRPALPQVAHRADARCDLTAEPAVRPSQRGVKCCLWGMDAPDQDARIRRRITGKP